MSTKKVSTKITRSERINLRCTKAFKAQLEELCAKKGVKISEYIIDLCVQEIAKNAPERKEVVATDNKKYAHATENSPNNKSGNSSYVYHTPTGEFFGSNPAAKANGLTRHTLEKNCKNNINGYSRELVE